MGTQAATIAQPIASSRAKGKSGRLSAIDMVRGLAMVSMLIVHTNSATPGFGFRTHFGWDAPNFAVADPMSWLGLFFAMATPAFFLLAGFGIALFEAARRRKGWSEWQITRFLVTRGSILIMLDFLVLPWYIPSFEYFPHRYFVLLTIGLCLLAIAFLRLLDWRVLALLAVGMTLFMQVTYHLTPIPGDVNYLRAALLYPSPAEPVKFGFPFYSWLPVMIGGYLITRYLNANREKFARVTFGIGAGLLAAWGILTLINDFGVLYPEHPIIVTKHPPSLAYLSFYLGLTFLLLSAFHYFQFLQDSWAGRRLATLGQTALFFYVMHIYALIGAKEIVGPFLPMEGFGLAAVYVVVALIPLYWLSSRYRALRKAHPDSVLRYL